jgi:hypothetical protein
VGSFSVFLNDLCVKYILNAETAEKDAEKYGFEINRYLNFGEFG